MSVAEDLFSEVKIYQTGPEKVNLDELAVRINETSVEKGFWDEPVKTDKYMAKLALIHSELTEILEAIRKSQGSKAVTEEFADVVIRTLDLYKVLVDDEVADPNLQAVIASKMEKNAARPPKHGHVWG